MPTGSISGSVLNADGTPIRNVGVELYLADLFAHGSKFGWWEFQGHDGRFSFDHVAPGEYLLVVNRHNRVTGDTPFSRTLYVGMNEFAKSALIRLADGEQRENVNIRVGAHDTVIAKVRLDWAGFAPASGVTVIATNAEGERTNGIGGDSHYDISLLTGTTYTLNARGFCGYPPQLITSDVVDVDADRLPPLITLRFPAGCKGE